MFRDHRIHAVLAVIGWVALIVPTILSGDAIRWLVINISPQIPYRLRTLLIVRALLPTVLALLWEWLAYEICAIAINLE
jgi:hypothetical protein